MDTSNGLNNAIDYISPFACYENSKTVACVGKMVELMTNGYGKAFPKQSIWYIHK